MRLTWPKLIFACFLALAYILTASPDLVQAVTNDFCYTKTAYWEDTFDVYPSTSNLWYGGFCSNGTFNPWCESGTDWKFWYPSCERITFPCTKEQWESGLDCPGTTSCTWQEQACSTADSCTTPQPYLNPGLCQPEKWDNIPTNAIQACQISPTIYKTCCNSNGTLDGNCNGGDYTGTCPSGTITVQCGFADKPSCGIIL